MVKYRKNPQLPAAVCILFFVYLLFGLGFVVIYKFSIIDSILFLAILESPTIVLIPYACLRIEFNNEKVSLYCGFIKIRTFLWKEVSQVGVAYKRQKRLFYYIYISKRPITKEERDDINKIRIKDRKKFITIEYQSNIIEEMIKYSKIPFEFLPITGKF